MDFKVDGLREMQERLQRLPDKVSKQYMVSALKEGAKTVAAFVVEAAPLGKTGDLAASVHVESSNQGGESSATVACSHVGRFLDEGTAGRPAGGGRRSRAKFARYRGALVGAIKATHWFGNATEKAAPEATQATAATLKEKIEGNK